MNVRMNETNIRYENHSDNDRDQAVFYVPDRTRIVAWRVVGPLARDGAAILVLSSMRLEASWSNGESGLLAAEPFGNFEFEERDQAYAFRRTGRGREGMYAVRNDVQTPGGIAFCVRAGSHPLLVEPAVGYRQRLVLHLPETIGLALARGAVEGAPLDPDHILQDLATITLREPLTTIGLFGDLANGYFAREIMSPAAPER